MLSRLNTFKMFHLKHNLGVENMPTDALSNASLVISSLEFQIPRFDALREDY